MKRSLLALAATTGALFVAPAANATILLPGASGVPFSTIDASTRGTLLDFIQSPALQATTYTGFLRSAVYRNTLGTLDFYFQVAISTIDPGDEVFNLTATNFRNFTVDALVDRTDFDGAGIFTAAFNPNTDPSEPAGNTTTASRNGSGSVVRADFGLNGLEAAGQTSATYIFRTNALGYLREGGTFTTQDGSTAQRPNFSPAIPEPATWAMMLMGFAMVGFGLRRREKVRTRVNFAIG